MTTDSIRIAAALGLSFLSASGLFAQTTDSLTTPKVMSRWELVVHSGTLVPTGAQRDVIKRGSLSAAQLSYVVHPAFAVTSTLGWARSRDAVIDGNPKLDVFTYDVGAEVRTPRSITGTAVRFNPFAGAGAGGRSYNYRNLDVDATHNVAAYGSVGGEIGVRRVRVRLEARDYMTAFKPLIGTGAARTGNDVVMMAGVRFVAR